KSMRGAVYLLQRRHEQAHMLRTFEGPDGITESCPRRQEAITPLHALFLMNNPFPQARYRAIADRVRRLAGDNLERQAEMAFLLTMGRKPDAKERTSVLNYINQERNKPAGRGDPQQIMPD